MHSQVIIKGSLALAALRSARITQHPTPSPPPLLLLFSLIRLFIRRFYEREYSCSFEASSKSYIKHVRAHPELLAFVDPDFEINP